MTMQERIKLWWYSQRAPGWQPPPAPVNRTPPSQQNPQPAPNLPRWKCHKVVYADKITAIDTTESQGHVTTAWHLECGAMMSVGSEVIARGSPVLGDYAVQYEAGYQSWSPAKVFEEGYTRE